MSVLHLLDLCTFHSGNSGGPVFNQESKKVVGVAFASNTKTAEGTGFIIPVRPEQRKIMFAACLRFIYNACVFAS